jgi:hypothetical protein
MLILFLPPADISILPVFFALACCVKSENNYKQKVTIQIFIIIQKQMLVSYILGVPPFCVRVCHVCTSPQVMRLYILYFNCVSFHLQISCFPRNTREPHKHKAYGSKKKPD